MLSSLRLIETIIIGLLGGYLFNHLNLPLPWVLGALTFIMIWQGTTKRTIYWPNLIKNIGLIILGIYFGMYFTINTVTSVLPYLVPYIILTGILILTSIIISIFVTRWINVDKITSVFGSIPGGLTEMVIASEALHAKSSYVVIFQTIRLLTVLFTVPSVIIYLFPNQITDFKIIENNQYFTLDWQMLWFLIPAIGGFIFKEKIPAGIVIVPLAITALLHISPIELVNVPNYLVLGAQTAVGIGLGKNISFQDIRAGGKYGFVYFGVAIALIIISFGLGALLAYFTSLTLPTAILSVAPGGLIEMVLTASIVGGDPAIVSSLQLTRILIIIILVPPALKWYFSRKTNDSKEFL